MEQSDRNGHDMNYPSSAYSWDVLSEDVALKHMDRSTFLHREMSVPREIVSFFGLPAKGLSEPMPVQLVLGSVAYDAHIHMDQMGSRYRLLWKTDFSEQIIDRFPYVYRKYALNEEFDEERPVMRFERIGKDVYRVDLIESAACHEDVDPDFTDWADQELEAAVYAYFTMLNRELKGKKFNKAEVIRQFLSFELINRSRGSVEFRLQNISSVLQELCHPTVQAYPPRTNISPETSERIRRIIFGRKFLNGRDYTSTADPFELDRRTGNLLGKKLAGAPKGYPHPNRLQSTRSEYEKDPLVRAWVLQQARGICELCRKPGPFRDVRGSWYLETHHVLPLAEGGPDTVENTVALCPNCHRRCGVSPDADKVRQEIRDALERIE